MRVLILEVISNSSKGKLRTMFMQIKLKLAQENLCSRPFCNRIYAYKMTFKLPENRVKLIDIIIVFLA